MYTYKISNSLFLNYIKKYIQKLPSKTKVKLFITKQTNINKKNHNVKLHLIKLQLKCTQWREKNKDIW